MPTLELEERTERAVRAGKRLREMRIARGWTAMDIEKKTNRLFGKEGEINETQNGRIENGNIKRPSFEDAMKLARVYEITPQEMAVIFGLWPESAEEAKRPKELTAAELMANTLENEADRAYFLAQLGFVVANQRALIRMRERGLLPPPMSQSDWGKYRSSEEEE